MDDTDFNRILTYFVESYRHNLHHTSASLLVKQNINPHVIQGRLGHLDIRTTQIYAHVIAEPDIKAANALEELLQK